MAGKWPGADLLWRQQGKTTAAFGLAFRCAGWGRRVVDRPVPQKQPLPWLTAAERFSHPHRPAQQGHPEFTFQMNDEERRPWWRRTAGRSSGRRQLARAEEARLLVLDEVIDALGASCPRRSCAFLDERPASLEVVLTGHGLPEALERRADYITHMVKEKHPYDRGVTARREIEF